jgi:hypothetical protein
MSCIADRRPSLSREDPDVVELCCAHARRDCASAIGLAESSEIWRGELSRAAVGRTSAQAVRTPQSSKLIKAVLYIMAPKLISGSEAKRR